MALLATLRRGAATCCRSIFQAERRCQHTAAGFDLFSGEELYTELPEEQLASAGSQALRTDTFVREVAHILYKHLPSLDLYLWYTCVVFNCQLQSVVMCLHDWRRPSRCWTTQRGCRSYW